MSSHHFVIDNQEPFLFVKGKDFSVQVLEQLLEWNPTIIADTNSIAYFIDSNKKADVLIFDSPDYTNSNELIETELFLLTHGLEHSLLQILKNRNSNKINFISKNALESFVNFPKEILSQIQVFFFDSNFKLYKNTSKIFKKWVKGGTNIQLFDEKGQLLQTIEVVNDGLLDFPQMDVYWISEPI